MTDCPLRVPEGVYLIRNAVSGRVIESEHRKIEQKRRNLHTYVAPFREDISHYQLWTIFKKYGKEFEYTIRNYATGAVLDVFCWREQEGTQVVSTSPFGPAQLNQIWVFYGSSSDESYVSRFVW